MVGQTPAKSMKVNWDDDIPNMRKNKNCSKPPTSYYASLPEGAMKQNKQTTIQYDTIHRQSSMKNDKFSAG